MWHRYSLAEFFHQPSCDFNFSDKKSRGTVQNACKPNKKHVDMNSFCPSVQSCLSPERGTLHTRLDVLLIVSPRFGHQVGLSLLQTSPLCCLLLFGELPPHLLTDYLLQHTQKQRQQVTTDECTRCQFDNSMMTLSTVCRKVVTRHIL